jgi:hypothetical protein
MPITGPNDEKRVCQDLSRRSTEAELGVSALKSFLGSWNKHLQPKVDSLRLNVFDKGAQAFVVFLKCRFKISGVFRERVG